MMTSFKTFDVRWIWRYRLFYVAGIMIVQILFAVIFFTLYEEVNRGSTVPVKQSERTEHPKPVVRYKNDIGPKFDQQIPSPTVCNASGRETVSAINRARTSYCKQLILNTTCAFQNERLYPKTLPHSCPTNGLTAGKYLGCYRDSNNPRLLNGATYNSSSRNSRAYCMNKCVKAGFPYAGVEFGGECFCGNEEPSLTSKLPDTHCSIPCQSDPSEKCGGFYATNVFETGVARFSAQAANEASSYVENSSNPPVRIVFLLTLNGRAVRQVYRLLKMLFHRDHFFFIHVDERQDYMFRELLPLEMRLSNIRLSRRRRSTIWGGASLLTMLLQSMSELIESSWDWDFLINLSESDLPLKTNKELVAFLSVNRNRNFVKSHGRDVHEFIQKQGLDKTFVECDEHMWRVGVKPLPSGIVVDGGSDWIALSRPFINYVVTAQNDQLLDGLKIVFKYTLLPAESFFHTVLRNSMFCDTYINNNLRVTNWKRHLGCKCQYKHVVDWCGCSPNVFTLDDWSRIQTTLNKAFYFGRKFDPIVSQTTINRVQEWLYGSSSDEYNSQRKYWQNTYHHLDRAPSADDALSAVSSSLGRHSLTLFSRNDLKCADIAFKKLLQVHSFYEDDVQKAILVNFEAVTFANRTIEFESSFRSRPRFTFYQLGPIASRFVNLVVTTDFDAKEKISRNYVGAMGPSAEPVLLYQIVAGAAAPNLTVIWVSPTRTIVDVSYVPLNELPAITSVKSNIKTPLLAGEWSVFVVHDEELLASIDFVITPLKRESLDHLAAAQTKASRSGSVFESVSSSWQYLIPILGKVNAFPDPNTEHSSYVGKSLSDWTDYLVNKSYEMVKTCLVKPSSVDEQCGLKKLSYCNSTAWSSFSPDPKTQITTVNKLTGRLN